MKFSLFFLLVTAVFFSYSSQLRAEVPTKPHPALEAAVDREIVQQAELEVFEWMLPTDIDMAGTAAILLGAKDNDDFKLEKNDFGSKSKFSSSFTQAQTRIAAAYRIRARTAAENSAKKLLGNDWTFTIQPVGRIADISQMDVRSGLYYAHRAYFHITATSLSKPSQTREFVADLHFTVKSKNEQIFKVKLGEVDFKNVPSVLVKGAAVKRALGYMQKQTQGQASSKASLMASQLAGEEAGFVDKGTISTTTILASESKVENKPGSPMQKVFVVSNFPVDAPNEKRLFLVGIGPIFEGFENTDVDLDTRIVPFEFLAAGELAISGDEIDKQFVPPTK